MRAEAQSDVADLTVATQSLLYLPDTAPSEPQAILPMGINPISETRTGLSIVARGRDQLSVTPTALVVVDWDD